MAITDSTNGLVGLIHRIRTTQMPREVHTLIKVNTKILDVMEPPHVSSSHEQTSFENIIKENSMSENTPIRNSFYL